MDQEIDRAIDRALADLRLVKPAGNFLPRLRAHVEQQPLRTPIRWWIPFAASATAVVAGAVVAALVRPPRLEPFAASMTHPVTAPASPAPQESTAKVAAAASATRIAHSARTVRAVPRIAPAPDAAAVLVPPGQLAAIGRLLDAINAGDEQAASAVRKLGAGTAIDIAPIQIDPLVVPTMKESS